MTILPFSVIPKIPYETFTVEARKLLHKYSSTLECIEEKLDCEITKLIEESLHQSHALPTLEFWNRKLNEFYQPKSVINDFLFMKLLEISAFHQGFKKAVINLGEKETSGNLLRNSSKIINDQDYGPKNQKKISLDKGFCFVIPVHLRNSNALRFFRRLLYSILDQNLPPSKIIVIDDCSLVKIDVPKIDQTTIFVHRSNKRHGPAFSRNLGAEIACEEQYDIIAFLDYDVVLPKLWTKMVEKILKQEKGDLISGINCSYGTTWWDWYHDVNGTLNGRAYLNNPYLLYATTAALVVRSTVFEKIQFNETFQDAAGKDIDFCLRANQEEFRIFLAKHLLAKHDYGYTGSPFDDLQSFLSRFSRYGSSEPLLSFIHPDYHSQFYNSTGLSNSQAFSQKVIPEFPF